jgi:HAD superfamily phosphatase (TIGR01668 family)
MLTLITPHLQLPSVLELDSARVRALGLDGLLLDVDGTLKDHGAAQFPAAVVAWARALRGAGVRLCLLSNGHARRIEPLAKRLDVPFVAKAFKPLPTGCRAALQLMELRPARAAIVGDQVFADILAGRLAGLFTILVTPTSPVEPWFTRIKRPLERRVLRRLNARIPTLTCGQSQAGKPDLRGRS